MKQVKVNRLITAISLVVSLFSCSLDAMTVVQPKSTISMQRRQAMLATMPKGKIVEAARASEAGRKKKNLADILATSSCKENEFFIYQEGSTLGICVPSEITELCRTLGLNIQKKAIPIYGFSFSVIKNAFDVLKTYESNKKQSKGIMQKSIKRVINSYSRDQLIDITNCFNYLDVPEDLQNACLNGINSKYKGKIQAIVSNEKLNEDLRRSFITQPAVDCLTDLLEKKNLQATKKILRDYSSTGRQQTVSVGINEDGTKIVELLTDRVLIRDSAGKILLNQLVKGFNLTKANISPDGTKIVIGGGQNNLEIRDAASGDLIHNLIGLGGQVLSVAFSSDGSKIVSGAAADQNNLIVWDVETGNQIANIPGVQRWIGAVAFSFDGTKVIAGYISGLVSNSGIIEMWDLATQNSIKQCNTLDYYGSIQSLSLSRDNAKILYVARPIEGWAKAFLLDVNTRENIQLTEDHGIMNALSSEIFGRFTGKSRRIAGFASFACDDKKIIVGEGYGISILDIDDNYNVIKEVFLPQGDGLANRLHSMAVSLNGRKMVFGYLSGYPDHHRPEYPALIEYTIWTDEDEAMIKRLKNADADIDEIKLIFNLCAELKKQESANKLNDDDAELFKGFSKTMQEKLFDIFWPPKSTDWFSGW
jgi:WD40 repeat protein